MPRYNGHKNWNHWNVSLWLNNDESMYGWMVSLIQEHSTRDYAARVMWRQLGGQKTPDGAPYSLSAIRAAMVGI